MSGNSENIIFYEDCIKGISNHWNQLRKKIDLIIADPPFAIGFTGKLGIYNRKSSLVIDGYHEIAPENYREFTETWIRQAYKTLKPSGAMYIVSGWTHLATVLNAVQKETDLTLLNHIIWKFQFPPATQKKYVSSHYHILYYVNNPKDYTFNKIYKYPEDVWEIKKKYARGEEKNATKLPEELAERMVLFSSKPDDLILDPFMGNGTTACVCVKTGRKYFGFEINENARRIIENNIKIARQSQIKIHGHYHGFNGSNTSITDFF